jgi:hypothetical protein
MASREGGAASTHVDSHKRSHRRRSTLLLLPPGLLVDKRVRAHEFHGIGRV